MITTAGCNVPLVLPIFAWYFEMPNLGKQALQNPVPKWFWSFSLLVFATLILVCWQALRLWQLQNWQQQNLMPFGDQVIERLNRDPILLADISHSRWQAEMFFNQSQVQYWQQAQPYHRIDRWQSEPVRLDYWGQNHLLSSRAMIEDGMGRHLWLYLQWSISTQGQPLLYKLSFQESL